MTNLKQKKSVVWFNFSQWEKKSVRFFLFFLVYINIWFQPYLDQQNQNYTNKLGVNNNNLPQSVNNFAIALVHSYGVQLHLIVLYIIWEQSWNVKHAQNFQGAIKGVSNSSWRISWYTSEFRSRSITYLLLKMRLMVKFTACQSLNVN